jgi:hypothetical protein
MNSLNSADIRTMIKSLYYAIQWHESIIDSYKIEIHFADGVPERRVPSEFKKEVRGLMREVIKCKLLRNKLIDYIKNN